MKIIKCKRNLKMQEKLKCMNRKKNDAERGVQTVRAGGVKMKRRELGLRRDAGFTGI
jgi:hypothetical protein